MSCVWAFEEGRDVASREKQVVRTGTINVVGNLLLAILKFVLGAVTQSIAITLDGVNSLTDSFTSVLTIVGTKIAQRPPDYEHPFGHGRYEYLTSVVVASLIIAAGASSLSSSIHAIVDGSTSTYTVMALVLIGFASVTKAGLGIYTRAVGKKLDSSPLVANGTDSLMDSIVSASTLLAAILNMAFGIGIESYLAAAISVFIIKSGIQILLETISKIVGERQDPRLANRVEKAARSVEGVKFVSGIVITDFGPNKYGGSLHVTVDKNMTVSEFDEIAREVYRRVIDECGVVLVSVGVYPAEEISDESRKLRAEVSRLLWSHEHIVEVRGLIVDVERKICRFDAVADYSIQDLGAFGNELNLACQEVVPGFTFEPHVRRDVGD